MLILNLLLGTTHSPSHFPDHLSHKPHIGNPIADSLWCWSPLHLWWGPSETNATWCIFWAAGSWCVNPSGSWRHISLINPLPQPHWIMPHQVQTTDNSPMMSLLIGYSHIPFYFCISITSSTSLIHHYTPLHWHDHTHIHTRFIRPILPIW